MIPEESKLPGFWVRLLEWFCPPELAEGLLCDLEEQFYDDLEHKPAWKVRLIFSWNVIRLFHPVVLSRKEFFKRLKLNIMLKSHLVVTVRTMMRNKFYSFINILGLSFSMALLVLVMLFVKSEFSKDQFHLNGDQIYRVYHSTLDLDTKALLSNSATTSVPLSQALNDEFDQIINHSRFGSNSGTVLKEGTPYAESVHFVDPGFFRMFSFPVLAGNQESPLGDLSDVVLSRDAAIKYFGESDPVGELLTISFNNQSKDFRVSAVVSPEEKRSTITFDLVLHIEQFREVVGERAFTSPIYGFVDNFVQLAENVSPEAFSIPMTAAYKRGRTDERYDHALGLQALTDIYLDTSIPASMLPTGDPDNSYILTGLVLLVLIIAVINFITLSTSQALRRTKEAGVRKAIGAAKRHLREQLITESLVFVSLSALLGLILSYLLVPYFSDLAESSLSFSFSIGQISILVATILLIALISGLIQSGILVRIKASMAMAGRGGTGGKRGSILNKLLIVIQFSLSIGLIVGTTVMRNQLRFLNEKDLGYNKERLVQISMNNPGGEDESKRLLDRFRNAISANPAVLNVTGTLNDPLEPWTLLFFPQEDGSQEQLYYNQVDADYLQTMQTNIVTGQGFNGEEVENGILVNQALVDHFGWSDPLNEQIPGSLFENTHRILGVVEDFHFENLKEEIKPLILARSYTPTIRSGVRGLSTYRWPPMMNRIIVRIAEGEILPLIDDMEKAWASVNPGQPFLLRFVDEVLNDQYATDTRWRKIIDNASVLAIMIAWLGLLGLTRISVQKRVKEIGIRKVLGSPVSKVVMLLSKDMVLLILISNLIAWPIVWWQAQGWLTNFAYRMELNLLLFALVSITIMALAIGSVTLQVLKAALANPVKSLRYE